MTQDTTHPDYIPAEFDYSFDMPIELDRPGKTIKEQRSEQMLDLAAGRTMGFWTAVAGAVGDEMDSAGSPSDEREFVARQGMVFALTVSELADTPTARAMHGTPSKWWCDKRLKRAEAFFNGYQHGRGRRSTWKREGLMDYDRINDRNETNPDFLRQWDDGFKFGETGNVRGNDYIASIARCRRALRDDDLDFFLKSMRRPAKVRAERKAPRQRQL